VPCGNLEQQFVQTRQSGVVRSSKNYRKSLFSLTCGNGVIDSNEECDDGNLQNDDGCTNDCRAISTKFCRNPPDSTTTPAEPCGKNDIKLQTQLMYASLRHQTGSYPFEFGGSIAWVIKRSGSCIPKLVSDKHPDTSTAATGGCENGLNLHKAIEKCGEEPTCTGFWLYTNGRYCPKATYSASMTNVISGGQGFYECKRQNEVTP
jgi:cysteine-rich repeat protein